MMCDVVCVRGTRKLHEALRIRVGRQMRNDVHGPNPTLALSAEVLAECTNREGLCSFWAAIGKP